MLRRLRPVVLTLACLSAPGVLAAQDVGYRVIVNATNPVGHLTRDQVSKIFLRRINQWDNPRPDDRGDAAWVDEPDVRRARRAPARAPLDPRRDRLRPPLSERDRVRPGG